MRTMLLAVAALMVVGCGGSERADTAAISDAVFEAAPTCGERTPHVGFGEVECCEAGALETTTGCGAYFVYCRDAYGYRLVDGEWVPETPALSECR